MLAARRVVSAATRRRNFSKFAFVGAGKMAEAMLAPLIAQAPADACEIHRLRVENARLRAAGRGGSEPPPPPPVGLPGRAAAAHERQRAAGARRRRGGARSRG